MCSVSVSVMFYLFLKYLYFYFLYVLAMPATSLRNHVTHEQPISSKSDTHMDFRPCTFSIYDISDITSNISFTKENFLGHPKSGEISNSLSECSGLCFFFQG